MQRYNAGAVGFPKQMYGAQWKLKTKLGAIGGH